LDPSNGDVNVATINKDQSASGSVPSSTFIMWSMKGLSPILFWRLSWAHQTQKSLWIKARLSCGKRHHDNSVQSAGRGR
jgi:hypothetical protein